MHYVAILLFERRSLSFNGEVQIQLCFLGSYAPKQLFWFLISFLIFWLSSDTSRAFLRLFQKQIKEAAVHVELEFVNNWTAVFATLLSQIFFFGCYLLCF